ncbi:hypothetical protein [Nonomuraea sp. LPB2021202275-12-8]|uniref:hypothetical protein n=1 Tax=Nonomuraea sp. LPB2021202275-12-8 TaxID=3120159 RepID=UPI00300CE0FC
MNELKNLARVHDENLAGQASGAGARALLTSITAAEPRFERQVARPGRSRRLLVGAVAVAGLAAAAVIGPAVLGAQGYATSYANSAIDIELRGDHYVAVIKDPLADHAKFTEGFKAVGLDVTLELVPSSPTAVGEVTGMSGSLGPGASPARGSIGSGTEPSGCELGQAGCAMTILVQRDHAGSAVVRLGRAAQPGEKYENGRPATRKGEMLEGFRVDEKPVGEVLAEVRERGLRAVFEVITPAPGDNGWKVEPGKQSVKVGDDWTVWEAQSEQAGVVRLMVTEERLPQNPVYGGPKPAELND